MPTVASAGASTTAVSTSAPSIDTGETIDVVILGNDSLSAAAIRSTTGTDADIVDRWSELDATVISVPASDANAAAAALAGRNDVGDAYVASEVSRSVIPTDPNWSRQRWMPDQNVPAAWSTSTGNAGIVIASIDSGVNETPDLAGRVLTGWDFVNERPGARNADDDIDRHGTVTSEVMAAAGENNYGMAGMCWNCRILPVKVLDAAGSGYSTDVARGIRWAVDNGAHVINLSLGGEGNDPLVASAVAYAESRRVVVVGAAGNDYAGVAGARYPAALPTVVGVGSYVTKSQFPASFSQRGSQWYELAAGACALDGLGLDLCGTSFSAPYVAGTAALMRGVAPELSPASIRSALYETATQSPMLTGPSGFRYGVLDAGAAVNRAVAINVPPPDTFPPAVLIQAPGGYNSGIVTLAGSTSDASGVSRVTVAVGGVTVLDRAGAGDFSVQFDSRMFSDGPHAVTINAVDGLGYAAAMATTVLIDNANPTALLYSPGSGSTVRRHLDIGVYTADGSGIMGTFIIVNDQVVHGYLGAGIGTVRVPIRRNGRYDIVALTVDNAGRISGSNWSRVNGRTR